VDSDHLGADANTAYHLVMSDTAELAAPKQPKIIGRPSQYEIGQLWEDWASMARAYGPIRSEADIIRALRFIQFSCQKLRMGRRAPSLSLVARAAGLSRMTLYRITRDGTMSEKSKVLLRPVLQAVTFH